MFYSGSTVAERTKRYVNILLDEKMLRQVDDYRFKNRIESRTEAVRRLIACGLKSGKPTKDEGAK